METKLSVNYQEFQKLIENKFLGKNIWTDREIAKIIEIVMDTFGEVEVIKN